MDSKQCKMARAALGLSAQDLAAQSGVGYATVARFESGSKISDESRERMRSKLEELGAEFLLKAKRVGVSVPR